MIMYVCIVAIKYHDVIHDSRPCSWLNPPVALETGGGRSHPSAHSPGVGLESHGAAHTPKDIMGIL